VTVRRLLRWPSVVTVHPEARVATWTADATASLTAASVTSVRSAMCYFVHRLVYALPLMLAGVVPARAAPDVFVTLAGRLVETPHTAWQLLVALAQNSVFLPMATIHLVGTFYFAPGLWWSAGTVGLGQLTTTGHGMLDLVPLAVVYDPSVGAQHSPQAVHFDALGAVGCLAFALVLSVRGPLTLTIVL